MTLPIRVLLAIAAALAAAPAAAQIDSLNAPPSAERMLAVFVEDAVENRDGGKKVLSMQYALDHRTGVPRARLDSLLAGLEGIAATSEVPRARIRAVMQLSRMEDSAGFERMMRVYRAATAHPDTRDMVVSTMGEPKLARHRRAWIAHLAGLATAPAGVEDFPNAKFEAMRFLLSLGAPGHQALIDIHRRNLARDPEVRATLAEWIRVEFKVRESAPRS